MPFRPLPPSFVDRLRATGTRDGICLELGCGDGRFRRLLSDCGATCFGLDLLPPRGGSCADVVADARRPPIRSGSCDVVVAANLVHHLLPRDPRLTCLDRWTGLLKPGGVVYVFEDEPAAQPPGRRNFAALQAFLAELMPARRGPLLAASDFDALWRRESAWRAVGGGRQANEAVLDVAAVVAMLRGDGGRLAPPVAGLVEAIGRDGVAPGAYWWRCLAAAR